MNRNNADIKWVNGKKQSEMYTNQDKGITFYYDKSKWENPRRRLLQTEAIGGYRMLFTMK